MISLMIGTTWITVVILELIHGKTPDSRRAVFIRYVADAAARPVFGES